MSMATGVIVTKVKSMHGDRLRKEDYAELLKKKSIAEITGFLKNETQYRKALKDVRENNVHRGQLEDLLRRDMFYKTMKLFRYGDSSQKKYYQLHLQQIEIDLLLQRIRVLISQHFEDAIAELPIFLKDYTSFNLLRLGAAKSYDDLLEVVKNTMYYETLLLFRVAKGKEHLIDYTHCERQLQMQYYEYAHKTITKVMKGSSKKNTMDLFTTKVELSNMTKIYRLKKFYNAREDVIRDSLIPIYNRIPATEVEEFIAEPTAESFLKKLQNSKYHLYVDDVNNVFIEYYADKFQYKLAKKNIYFSQDAPVVFTSYLFLQQMELENIINIIEGVRYNVNSEDIENMLIY